MLLLRDSTWGPEVLMTRRGDGANFAAGAYVFPGGALDAADNDSHAIAIHRPQQTGDRLTQAIAAIRESFEELGILLAYRVDGSPANAQDVAVLDRVPPEGQSFASQCAAHGLRLAADQLRHLAQWIADPNNPKRFDTAFFVARAPHGQIAVADNVEQFEPQWIRPAQALEQHKAGAFLMLFPTIRTLKRLSTHCSVESILAACAGEEPLTRNATRTGLSMGVVTRFTDEEPAHGELALVSPDGQVMHCLDWQHLAPVALLRNVQRLTAPADPMTGHGTNSYLLGDPSTGYIAIDPGPDEPAHIERLWRAAGGDIRLIVHAPALAQAGRGADRHRLVDRSSGPLLLQAMCDVMPPILCLNSPSASRGAGQVGAERAAYKGERLVLAGPDATHTLVVIHVPGNAGHHLCLLLEEDGVFFTCGHMLAAETAFTAPAGTDRAGGCGSLDRLDASLDAVCRAHGVTFILPAYGHVRLGLQGNSRTANWPYMPDYRRSACHGNPSNSASSTTPPLITTPRTP